MTIPFFKAPVSLWDTLIVTGVKMPGLWLVKVQPSRKVQIEGAKDLDGVTMADNGYNGAKVTLTGRLWSQDQLDEFNLLFPILSPRSLGDPSVPVTVIHPVLRIAGIKSIYITQWDLDSKTDQYWHPKCNALEWFPAKKPKATPPAGSGSGSSRFGEFTEIPGGSSLSPGFGDVAPNPGLVGGKIP